MVPDEMVFCNIMSLWETTNLLCIALHPSKGLVCTTVHSNARPNEGIEVEWKMECKASRPEWVEAGFGKHTCRAHQFGCERYRSQSQNRSQNRSRNLCSLPTSGLALSIPFGGYSPRVGGGRGCGYHQHHQVAPGGGSLQEPRCRGALPEAFFCLVVARTNGSR